MSRITNRIEQGLRNFFDGRYDLVYLAEEIDWVIGSIGRQVTSELNKKKLLQARTSTSCWGLKNKVLHFGSINTILRADHLVRFNGSNTSLLTWFHVSDSRRYLSYIPDLKKRVALFHTASSITRDKLSELGIPQEKIVVIPLGVNLNFFKAFDAEKRSLIRKRLGLPLKKIVIGSFQKDGNGWGLGLTPKLIKGPDVFCRVVGMLAKKFDVHVLLTGPARGYVKKQLDEQGIPYTHQYLKEDLSIVDYYNALDMYIVSSREEGGPQAILESWACGVPIVSTRVGMARDIIQDGYNGMLAEVEDVTTIVRKSELILSDHTLRSKIVYQALQDARLFDWSRITDQYYELLYRNYSSR